MLNPALKVCLKALGEVRAELRRLLAWQMWHQEDVDLQLLVGLPAGQRVLFALAPQHSQERGSCDIRVMEAMEHEERWGDQQN